MECDFLEASPSPLIKWFMNNGTFPIAEETNQDQVLFVEEGRFLFIRVLTARQRNSSFHCEVVNAFLGTRPQKSPITYTLGGDIPPNTLETYIDDRSVTAIIGEPVRVVYAAATRSMAQISLSCNVQDTGTTLHLANNLVANFSGFDNVGQLNITCNIIVFEAGFMPFPTVTYSFNVARK